MADNKLPIKQLVEALLDEDKPFKPKYLYRFSDLTAEDLAALREAWPKAPAWRRQAIIEDLESLGDDDYVLSFEEFAHLALADDDPVVRTMAVNILMDYERTESIELYLGLMTADSAEAVRAAAAGALGIYVYMGEVEEISETLLHKVEDELIRVLMGTDTVTVRRAALESLGYSSRPEAPGLIGDAYGSKDPGWKASALTAMGRSANEMWNDVVLKSLDSDQPEALIAAVRAAGDLEIVEARPLLMRFLEDDDGEVRMAAAWSLSQIGGKGVRHALEKLYDEVEDDEEADFIESALDNLDFTEEAGLSILMDFDEDEEEFDEPKGKGKKRH
ncbi:MAG: HEAT repeat domain-containing protein [Chloroflexi bacterium]|nr:HEAT repeat domain-containing protein [Chloroflexota bacterium]